VQGEVVVSGIALVVSVLLVRGAFTPGVVTGYAEVFAKPGLAICCHAMYDTTMKASARVSRNRGIASPASVTCRSTRLLQELGQDMQENAITTPHDYWAPEPIANEAVAEWWAQQSEARRYTCGITGTDTCPSDVEKTKGCPSC
jgi:hypothetical protein